METKIEIQKEKLQELYKILTNYPTISKEQVDNEMCKVFGEDVLKKPVDVRERIKTFEDACRELGKSHPLVCQYNAIDDVDVNLSAFLKLRIIAVALNEGWTPTFAKDEYRYYPWFYLYSKDEYEELDEDQKARVVCRSNHYASASGGVSYAYADVDSASVDASIGSWLAFKSRELAFYSGQQFIDIWADYLLGI